MISNGLATYGFTGMTKKRDVMQGMECTRWAMVMNFVGIKRDWSLHLKRRGVIWQLQRLWVCVVDAYCLDQYLLENQTQLETWHMHWVASTYPSSALENSMWTSWASCWWELHKQVPGDHSTICYAWTTQTWLSLPLISGNYQVLLPSMLRSSFWMASRWGLTRIVESLSQTRGESQKKQTIRY